MDKPFFWSGIDALGRPITLLRRPTRIISLVPSQTELLIDLGLGDRLVGRTRYCIHPKEKVTSVKVVGGTKRVDMKTIEALKPDLVIAEKEETPQEMVNELAASVPVYVTNVVSIPSAISMCRDVGRLVGLATEADSLAQKIETTMQGVRNIAPRPERVLYLIWRKPWMAAGEGTFIHGCLEHIGFKNAILSSRYPEVDAPTLTRLNPDRVYLSTEPFPFKEIHAQEIREILPHVRIELVDGELFSWYGSRMLKMPAYWRALTH
jgi:ABC-type Fe3+-hydroxamate transport system substrate-binding protein